MLLSCSDKVSNITISPSSPKNCYKPISKIAPIYSAKTVSSSRRQCKLLGWIMSVSFRGVYQRGSITHRPKSEIGPATSASFSFSLSLALSPLYYRQLVCCHGTACCYCSGHKMVPSHTTTWQHRGSCATPVQAGTGTRCGNTGWVTEKKTHRPKSQKLTLTVRGWFCPSIINLLMVFLKLTDWSFCQ